MHGSHASSIEDTLRKVAEVENGDLEGIEDQLQAMLEDDDERQALLEKRGDDAQSCLDRLQMLADSPKISTQLRSTIFKMMIRLSRNSGCCPRCLAIHNVRMLGEHPVGFGGFGDVWKGTIGHTETAPIVCLKVLRVHLTSDVQASLKEYLREAIVWKQLKHPNLLPFLGIYYLDDTRQRICLVSPWMERGNLVQFLKDTPRESVDHLLLVNILITPDQRACIADFGLSRIADTNALRMTSSNSRMMMGTARWLAPELFNPNSTATKESDIYAFACVCYEIYTGLLPFHEFRHDPAVACQVQAGTRPSRSAALLEFPDVLWSILEKCWKPDLASRPSASAIMQDLTLMRTSPLTPSSAWNDSIANAVWSNLEHPTSIGNKPASLGSPPQPVSSDHENIDGQRPGPHTRWILDLLKKRKQKAEHSGSSGSHSDSSGSYASTTSSVLTRHFPNQFFILQSSSEDTLTHSASTGLWSGAGRDTERALDRAYRTSEEVFLIFAVKNSDTFWGYAKMAGSCKRNEGRFLIASRVHRDPSPLRRPALSSSTVPESLSVSAHANPEEPTTPLEKVLDQLDLPKTPTSPAPMTEDEASHTVTPTTPHPIYRGERHTAPDELGGQHTKLSIPIHPNQSSLDSAPARNVEYFPNKSFEEEVSLPDPELQDGLIVRTEEPKETESDEGRTPSQDDGFRVDWICTDRLPYSRTGHILNSRNRDRQVNLSEDDREVEPSTGQQIIDEWQRFIAEVRAGDRGRGNYVW
ncbi:Rho guanine nucleotide exchange factor [Marasmius crinis-equi]|uniref:Rho guanine nucleotide exchange factor n=1 Tax=Marasmius crinis-equi TaxID=585013 RepID=A0ABR3EYU3_9AGAR